MNEIFKNGINDKITSDLFYALNKDKFIYDCDNKEWYGINEYGIYEKDTSLIIIKRCLNNAVFTRIEDEKYKRTKALLENDEAKLILEKMYKSIATYMYKNQNKDAVVGTIKNI